MQAQAQPQRPVTVCVFRQCFSATRLGARLARHLALHRLDAWGIPHGTRLSDSAGLIVAELGANAVTHGRVPGRDFEVCLSLFPGTLRIEVSDTRTEKRPPAAGAVALPPPESEAGRGLFLVAALADRWAVLDRRPVGKTVRAELDGI
jgi:anti-sigma regulatory factor (Ser/Thr protein kinase)